MKALEPALAARPDHPETQLSLGVALVGLGRVDDGIRHCRRAVELNPDAAGPHLRLGMALAAKSDLRAAYKELARAVELDPTLAETHYQLGVTLHLLERPDAAVHALKRALALRPKMIRALDRLARALTDLQQYEEAIGYYKQALALDSRSPTWHRGIGQVLHYQGRFEEARAAFGKALEREPKHAPTYVHLGLTYQAEGYFEEAVAWQKKAIAIDPNNPDAHHALAVIHRFEDAEGRVRELERRLSTDSLDVEQRAVLNFALGRLYDEVGNFDLAFGCFKAANDLRRTQSDHSPDNYTTFFDRIIATFGKELFHEKAGMGSELERPVFVFGMMRSGTTLVEQILASHPQVHGHGELGGISLLAQAMSERLGGRKPYPESAVGLDATMARALADIHLAQLEREAGDAVRSVDKQVFNFTRLGLIALLFPRAQLIHCIRDPLDTCLSGFFQDFGPRNAFTCDLEHIGCYYRDYKRMMAHWHAVLPIPILDVPYEELVGDQEGWSRKLVDFVGLPWDQSCLAFYETKRPVFTASLWQVRQPIYTSSVGRWRHYAKHLGPLFQALGIEPSA